MAEIEVKMTFKSIEEMVLTLQGKRAGTVAKPTIGEELQKDLDARVLPADPAPPATPPTDPPSAPPTDPAPPATEPDGLDADGVPWDERIHAGTKGKTQKGKWKRRKGITDALYLEVTNELKGNQTKVTNVTKLPTSAPPTDPAPQAPEPPPVEQPQAPGFNYMDLIQKFGSMNYGINDMNTFLKKNCNIESIALLSVQTDEDPDLPQQISALLDAAGPLPPKE